MHFPALHEIRAVLHKLFSFMFCSQAEGGVCEERAVEERVRQVERVTGYDLDGASDAVRNVTWSVAVQHGRAAEILTDAVRRTDRTVVRSDPTFDARLIDNVYARRGEHVRRVSERQRAAGKRAQADQSAGILKKRYPQEHADALEMLRKERGQ